MSEQLENEVEIGGYAFKLEAAPCLQYIFRNQYNNTIAFDEAGFVSFESSWVSCYFEFSLDDLRKMIKLGEKLKAHMEAKR